MTDRELELAFNKLIYEIDMRGHSAAVELVIRARYQVLGVPKSNKTV